MSENYIRVYCVCGEELEIDHDDPCSSCGAIQRVVFDPETRQRITKKRKAHSDTCECEVCESNFIQAKELDFGY